VRTAPASFALTPRNPAKRVTLGGNHLNFGLVAGPPNVHDFERGPQAGAITGNYCDFIRLAAVFHNAIHLIGNQVCAPIELPANSRHLDTYRGEPAVFGPGVSLQRAIGSGRARGRHPDDGGRARPRLRTDGREPRSHHHHSRVNSPRRFDEAMSDGLYRHGPARTGGGDHPRSR